jgi:hypothetical protein
LGVLQAVHITDPTHLQSNYARSTTILLVNNAPYTPASDINGKDGLTITAEQYNSAAWWQAVPQFPADAWNFRNGPPTLKGFTSVQ